MKKVLLTFTLVFALNGIYAQQIENAENTLCHVEVAFAISEGDDFGEYSMTRLVEIIPGERHDFRMEPFEARRIYSKAKYDEMFIVRFKESGITHFLDARPADGYEEVLNGGCTLDQRPFVSKDGLLMIDASVN